MKKILSLLLLLTTVITVWAKGGSGQGFDPSNPPDPQMGYRLTVKTAPEGAGTTNHERASYVQAEEYVWLETNPRLGYEFRAWMVGDSVISTERNFYFQMPAEKTELTAWFDKVDFNPSNPGDPYLDGYTHKVNVYVTPSIAGWVNNNNFLLKEGDETWLSAYPNSSFKFSCWKQDGKIISTDRDLPIKMGDKNLEYTAQFVFDPSNPGEPWPNSWNEGTGELIIDHFEPGRLWDAIYQMTEDNYGSVANLKVIGRMDPYDIGVVRNLTGLTEADFSRTSGYNYVPSWIFENCEALTKVLLPSSVTEIHDYAFYNCQNLSELVLYSAMPPSVYYEAFYGVPENLVVKVYSGSVDIYMETEPWSSYKIMTIDEDSTALSVTLPEDAADGRYRNASLQLNNLSTGQSQKLVITGNRTKFLFGNLIPETKYSLYVLAPNGQVIGSYLDFEMPKEGFDYVFPSLLQLQEVKLALTTPEGEDKAGETAITWFDEKHSFIGSGSVLSGLVQGYQVNYEITLPRELAIEYVVPENGNWVVKESDNNINIELLPLNRFEVKGKLMDAQLDEPLQGGYVTITQTINGQHSVSATATTDADGAYTITVYDVPGVITAGSPDHIEMSVGFNTKEELEAAANMSVKPLAGTEVLISLLSRDNIEKDAVDHALSDYKDFANVEFTVTNLTKGNNIDFRLRYPRMLLLDQVDEGDEIDVKATPRNSGFNGSSDKTVISGDKGEVKITFTSNGDLKTTYVDSDADEVVGLLYDKEGRLYKKGAYADNALDFLNLPDGDYTLVTMMSSKLFSAAGSLAELQSSRISACTDYIVNGITVESGYISHIDIDVVPVFDESLFYYTGAETSVSVNKTSVTVGQIVTVRSKVDFLPEYADGIEKVNVIFTIPEGCDYVENSLLVAGNGANFTTTSDGRLSVEMEVKDASPRFCIIPRKGGDYRPSAVIEFEYEGELISQPIGSALFTAGDFTISVPEKTSVTRIAARGTATALSEVKVYDNDVFIGSTRSLTNGDWRLKFDLYNPGDYSEHYIYAEITTPEGVKYKTTTGKTIYDKDWAELTDINMIYGGTKADFDYIEATTVPSSYSYVPGNDMFTFKAIFREGHAKKVRNLEFVILLSDGSRRRIDGKYIQASDAWVCALSFPDINRLPVNVKTYYVEKRDSAGINAKDIVDNVNEQFRCPDIIPIIDPSGYVYEAVPSNRLSGVMATIYYKEWAEDMYGEVSEKVVKWDAEAYAQENPLFTDADGMYQWDVPQGEWQVRFEKEGYEAASTEWLPVPPPQLDVNIGMIQTVRPEVKDAHAYEQSIEFEFDKYMTPSLFNSSNVIVSVNGEKVDGEIVMINPEEVDGATYASAIRFEADQPFAENLVTLMISNKVTSYAGIQMEETFVQEFLVEPSITAINVDEQIQAYIGEEGKLTVEVLPGEGAAGKTLSVKAGSSIVTVEQSATLNNEGKAEIAFIGDLPGEVDITVSVDGSSFAPVVSRLILTVPPVFAEIVNLDKKAVDLTLGDKVRINATVLPEETEDKTVVWASSDESVAMVDENGNVVMVGVGNATITASCGKISSECVLKSYPKLGDANWNGEITIADAVDISNYVVQKKTAPQDWDEAQWTEFYVKGANVNESEDGNITFADASATVSLVLDQPLASSVQSRIVAVNNIEESSDALVIANLTTTEDGRSAIAVTLDNSIDYVALQADVTLPEGLHVELKPGSRVAGSHSLESRRIDDSHIRVAIFDLGNQAFAANNEPILELVADSYLSGVEGISVSHILAADSDANEYRLGCRVENTTGVESMENDSLQIIKVADNIHIVNAIGNNVEICTIEGKIVKSFVAKDALEIVNLSSGLYVVKAGNKTLKVIL